MYCGKSSTKECSVLSSLLYQIIPVGASVINREFLQTTLSEVI